MSESLFVILSEELRWHFLDVDEASMNFHEDVSRVLGVR